MGGSVFGIRGRIETIAKVTATAFGVLLLSSCAAKSGGHLVVIGGALKDDNAAVFDRIMTHAGGKDAPLAIVPTASGVPDEVAPENVERFNKVGAASYAVKITKDAPQEANNPERAADIRRAKAVFFTGGVQERILAAFRPDGGTSLADGAVREVLAQGGVVAGTSAGAAMMSDPMIKWGVSEEALLVGARCDGEDRAVCVTQGMGFFPYGVTDQHFLKRGRTGRLIVATHAAGKRFGFGVDENRAMNVNLATNEIEAVGGARAVLVVDLGEARHEGLAWSNIRVSLLNAGDRVNGLTGKVTPAGQRIPYVSVPTDVPTVANADKPWDDYVVSDAIEALSPSRSAGGAASVVLRDANFELRFSRDGKTLYHDGGSDESVTAVDVRLDIAPREGAAQAAAALDADIKAGKK